MSGGGFTLLHWLDALIRADPGPSRIVGSICFGLRSASGAKWWHVAFDGRAARSEFVERPPDNADVIVGLDEKQIEALLSGSPSPSLRVAGDRAILDRFAERYLHTLSPLTVRIPGGAPV
jgi:hypothetical protein